MPSAFPLSRMTDAELVQHANAVRSDLTSTELELELADRLEYLQPAAQIAACFDDAEGVADGLKALIESHPGSLEEQTTLLTLLNDEDIHTPDQLRELIARAKTFRAIAEDAGDVVERLSALITETQE